MAIKIHAEQISRLLATTFKINNIAATNGSTIITTNLTTALQTAGDFNSPVPLQSSVYSNEDNKTQGLVVTAPNNRIEVYNAADNRKINSPAGNEVYGRLTVVSNVYTLTYFTLVATVETPFSFTAPTTINIEVLYLFELDSLPVFAISGIKTRNVYEDGSTGGSGAATNYYQEVLTITAQNTLPPLTKTPSGAVIYSVSGQLVDDNTGGSVTRVNKTLTWNQTNAGYNLNTYQRVVATYPTLE